MQQREQGVRPVQRDDVAAVFDDVSGEMVGDRAELAFQRRTDGPGAQRHRWHRQGRVAAGYGQAALSQLGARSASAGSAAGASKLQGVWVR